MTDEEIDDLYDSMDVVKHRMAKDENFNMDDKKWDEIVKEGIEHGFLKDTKECKEILEDMLSWDKLLPGEIKKKVDKKFNEIAAMIEAGEMSDEKGYELFKEYEDKMVLECAKLMEAEGPPQFDDSARHEKGRFQVKGYDLTCCVHRMQAVASFVVTNKGFKNSM